MGYIPQIEKQGLRQQEEHQLQRLRELVGYVSDRSPFYKRALGPIGPSDLRSLSDISKLPITEKQDLQNNPLDFLCVPPSAIREYVSTTGTTGRPVHIALSAADLERLSYNEYLSFSAMDLSENDIVQLMLTLDRQFLAGIAYYNGLLRTGATIVRSGPGLPGLQWETIEQLRSTALVTVPSFLYKMLGHAVDSGIDRKRSPVKKILAIGENLRDEAFGPNALAQKIKALWDVQLFGSYASTEMQTAFTECQEGAGGHHHPELVILELLDDEGREVGPGDAGEVTITTLGIEAMPLLRYRTGDICQKDETPCACGRKTIRLGPVLGRKQHRIKFKGTSMFPQSISNAIESIPFVSDHFLKIDKDNEGLDRLTLYLVSSDRSAGADYRIKETLKHQIRAVPNIVYIDTEGMRSLQYPPNSRKAIKYTMCP